MTQELAATESKGKEGWQPIETAPRDGAWVWLYCPDGVQERSYEVTDAPLMTMGAFMACDCSDRDWYSVESWTEFWDYGGMTGAGTSSEQARVSPTHWMPLPPAPVSA